METGSLIAKCGERVGDALDDVQVDVPLLLSRLLLFDTYVMDCALRLRDLVGLVKAIGIENAGLLLEEGGLRLAIDTASLAFPTTTTAGVVADPMAFAFGLVSIADPLEHTKNAIWELDEIPGYKHRKLSKLARQAQKALLEPPRDHRLGELALQELKGELAGNGPLLRSAVGSHLGRVGLVLPEDFRLRFDQRADGAFVADTNLPELLGTPEDSVRQALGQGILAIGGLNLRLERMRAFGSVTAFNDEDFAIMDERLSLVVSEFYGGQRMEELRRVLVLAELPSFEDADPAQIDYGKFVELRARPEMHAFRRWLGEAARATDEEVQEQLRDVRSRVSDALRSRSGRGVRLAVSTGLGAIPLVGPIVGAGAGVLDEFVVDKVAGEPGPVAVFARGYRSMLRGA